MNSEPPLISVILIAHAASENLWMALRFLRAQTVASRLECILMIASSDKTCVNLSESEGLFHLKVVEVGSHSSHGEIKAIGVKTASAPLVAFMEDHSYPSPNWAEALIAAHQDDRVAVAGPVMRNLNSHSSTSWGCFLAFYSQWMAVRPGSQANSLPSNQSCYKRNLLLEYGSQLPEILEAEDILHRSLLRKGHKILLEAGAPMYHMNYSAVRMVMHEYFFGSRVFAAGRTSDWGLLRRIVYFAGAPLIPVIRLPRILGHARRARLNAAVFLRAFPALMLILSAGAAGEMLGYALGAGEAGNKLCHFMQRGHTFYTPSDLEAVSQIFSAYQQEAPSGRRPQVDSRHG